MTEAEQPVTTSRETSGDEPTLIAYYGASEPPATLLPSARTREWMEERQRWAYRCLPLVIANQAGWVLLNPVAFRATWDGGEKAQSVRIELLEEAPESSPIVSIFGYGVVTWGVPYLFRTPPGYNLLARGPANSPKDGISPLEGLVETDWATATFTMNWKLTRPDHPVTFERDEPYCMIVPQRRGELETFRPEFRHFSTDEQTTAEARLWAESRAKYRLDKFVLRFSGDLETDEKGWQGHYYRGTSVDGTAAPEHQTKLQLRDFARDEGTSR